MRDTSFQVLAISQLAKHQRRQISWCWTFCELRGFCLSPWTFHRWAVAYGTVLGQKPAKRLACGCLELSRTYRAIVSGSAVLNRFSTTARYSSLLNVPSLSGSAAVSAADPSAERESSERVMPVTGSVRALSYVCRSHQFTCAQISRASLRRLRDSDNYRHYNFRSLDAQAVKVVSYRCQKCGCTLGAHRHRNRAHRVDAGWSPCA